MKVTCSRPDLQSAFQLVSSVISARTIRPVHQNVKMEVIDAELQLVATDGDVDIRITVDNANIQEAGSLLLPSQKVNGILRESVDESLTIESADGGAAITGSDSRFMILSEPPEEFPDIAHAKQDVSFEIVAADLARMIGKTMFAAAQDTTRYSLNGVLFTLREDVLVLVATDGRRMAKIEGKIPTLVKEFTDVIVPTKALVEVSRVMHGDENMVKVTVEQREITFSCGPNTISARSVAGTFPRYEDAIPVDCDKKAEINTAQLMSGVRRAALLTSIEARMVKFTFADGALVLNSSSREAGEATIKVPADFGFDDIEIAFNPVFIEDMLRVADGDTVSMEMKSKNSQALIRAGEKYIYVVMPVILPEQGQI